jgi:hypothetical protein
MKLLNNSNIRYGLNMAINGRFGWLAKAILAGQTDSPLNLPDFSA